MTDEDDLKHEIISIREHNSRLKESLRQAKNQLENLKSQLLQVGTPPLKRAVFESFFTPHTNQNEASPNLANVTLDGRHYRLALRDTASLHDLQPGDPVWVDSNLIVVDADIAENQSALSGEILTVTQVHCASLAAKTSSGNESMLQIPKRIGCASTIKAGSSVLADTRNGWVMRILAPTGVEQVLQPEKPNITYEDIGGLETEISQLKEAIELPYTHRNIFEKYGMRQPRGVLLYGPPGCGKTMLAKAVAASLGGETGNSSVFLSVKGPELLSKFVGETERQIRMIFNRARELATPSQPVVVFFDEMEALFRTRGTGISSDMENLLVPQLLTEMDGLEELRDVIVIGASNREDMIDPALLRPGRFDIKIRVNRPGASAAREILSRQFSLDTPFDQKESQAAGGETVFGINLVETAVNRLFMRNQDTYIATVRYQEPNGKQQDKRIYYADLISGAVLVKMASRAKTIAVKREIEGRGAGLRLQDLEDSLTESNMQMTAITSLLPPAVLGRELGIQGEITRIYASTTHSDTGGAND